MTPTSNCDWGPMQSSPVSEETLMAAAYDEGYKAAMEDSAPPNVWAVMLHFDGDFSYGDSTLHSIVGSEFAAQETIDELNTANTVQSGRHYWFKEMSIDCV